MSFFCFKKILENYKNSEISAKSTPTPSGMPFMHWPKPEKVGKMFSYLDSIKNNKRKNSEDFDTSLAD
jgi:hypothetical protein